MNLLAVVMLGCAVAMIVLLMTGCSPKVTEDVRSVRTDTVYVWHTARDSVYLHDSLYIHEYVNGDTIYVDRTRWREKYVDRWKRDTVYESRVDTLTVYREVIKEPTVMERWKKTATDVAVTVAVMAIGALFLWLLWRPKSRNNNNQ